MNKNVPNILTMSRIACTPLVVLFFLLPIPYGIGKYIAFAIYVLACFTDLLDGKIARKYNLISDFGKFMDQIADKFITTTSMILVLFLGAVSGWIPMWASVIMLLIVVLRDILLGGIRMVAANKNIVIAADIFGKIKSLFLDTANAVLLFYVALSVCVDNWFTKELKYLGLSLMIVGVTLSVISCVNYIKGAIDGLKAKETEDSAETENEEVEEAETNEESAESATEESEEETPAETKNEAVEGTETSEEPVEPATETSEGETLAETKNEAVEETETSEEPVEPATEASEEETPAETKNEAVEETETEKNQDAEELKKTQTSNENNDAE